MLTEQVGALEQRQEDDRKETNRRLSTMHTTILRLPAKQDVTDLRDLIVDSRGDLKLATKADVEQIVQLFNSLKSAASIIGGTGKWSWRVLLGFAMFIAVVTVITGGAKAGLAYMISLALGGRG